MRYTHIVRQTKLMLDGHLAGIEIQDTMHFRNVDEAMIWCKEMVGKTYEEWNSDNRYTVIKAEVERIES